MLEYFTITTVLTLLTHAYFALRLWPPLADKPRQKRIVRALLLANVLLLPASMVLTLRAPAAWSMVAVPVAHVAFTDVGFCILLFVGLLVRDVFWFVGRLAVRVFFRDHVDNPERRKVLLGSLNWAVVGATGATTATGYALAHAAPVVHRIKVACSRWRSSASLRIVQISDLHIGPTIRRSQVQNLVDLVNTLQADIVVITGDLVDGFVSQLHNEVAPLGGLKARHGVYFVTGNHEYFYRAQEWLVELQTLGIRVLSNGHAHLEHEGARVLLLGVDDPAANEAEAMDRPRLIARIAETAAEADMRILLAHRPSDAEPAANQGIDLQVSGHMHGGQFFPLTFLLPHIEPYVLGLYRVRDMWLYVNRGAGYWGPPNRLGVRQEVTVLEIVGA